MIQSIRPEPGAGAQEVIAVHIFSCDYYSFMMLLVTVPCLPIRRGVQS